MMNVQWLLFVFGVLCAGIKDSAAANCRFGDAPCPFPCHCEGDVTCDKVTGDCGDAGCDNGNLGGTTLQYTEPWRGPGCQIGNVALHKNATQNNVDTSYVASNAVDGDHDRIRSCIRTEEDLNTAAWWMVDLGADYIIYNITITTRNINAADTLRDTYTLTWTDEESNENKTTCDDIGSTLPQVDAGGKFTLSCHNEPIVRYIKLQHQEKDHSLQMCEVMVTGYLYQACDCGIRAPGCLECNFTVVPGTDGPGTIGPVGAAGVPVEGIIGGVIAVVVVVFIILVIVLVRRRRNKARAEGDSNVPLRNAGEDVRNGRAHGANGDIANDMASPYQEVDISHGFSNPRALDTAASPGSPFRKRAREPEPDIVMGYPKTKNKEDKPKKSPAVTRKEEEAPSYGNENMVGRPIPVSQFPNIMKKIKNDRHFIAQEYKQFPIGMLEKADVGNLEANKKKNRFKNIIPYDHTRVMLTCDYNNNSDYINANYMKTPGTHDTPYIATQGPMSATVPDFWRMVWQSQCNRIVMLTNLREGGKAQCSPYWPSTTPLNTGNFTITVLNVTALANHTLRTFTVKHDRQGKSRPVHHFHFTGWPDRGVPLMATSLLEFRRVVRSYDNTAKGPLIVHCSAGVGRTGAFIAIDQCLDQVEKEQEVDIFRVTEGMRTCRADMIQLRERYQFVYEAVHEAILSGETLIPCNEMEERYAQLMERGGGVDRIRLTKQYQALNSLRLGKDKQEKPDLDPKDKAKNRSRAIFASDRVRPRLSTAVQTDNCSSYINAVFVQGYRDRQAHIVTQLPLPTTVADFWRLVWDHEPCSIVLLHLLDTDDQSMPVYWPEHSSEDLPIPPLIIGVRNTTDVRHAPLCYRDFEITNTNVEGNPSRSVRQFHLFGCSSRDDVPGSPNDVLQLLELLEHWQQQTGNKPIIVQCIDGNQLSGVFCAACCLVEKLKVDQEVDVFLAVKQVRLSRPQFIISEAQYKFLYDLALAYMRKHGAYSNFS